MLQESILSRSIRCRTYNRPPAKSVGLEDVGGKRSFKEGFGRDWNAVGYRGINRNGLIRYLNSRVGKNWDEVLSDAKAQLRKEAFHEAREALEHDLVLTTAYLAEDGSVMAICYGDTLPVADTHFSFFVHPVTRVLSRASTGESYRKQARQREAERKARADADFAELGGNFVAMRLDGHWFKVELAPLPAKDSPYYTAPWWKVADLIDVVHGHRDAARINGPRGTVLQDAYRRPGVYAIRKWQLSAKDVRKLGLPD